MFEDANNQNETQSNDQSRPYGIARPSALDDNSMADQISSGKLFSGPQLSAPLGGAFTNQNPPQIDPQSDRYPKFGLPAANTATTGQASSGQKTAYLPPINPRDEQGKTLPKYRMGIGHRILASVANFANGFAGNGAAPIYVGRGALNNRYYQDEELRQQQNRENLLNTPAASDSGTAPGDDVNEKKSTNAAVGPDKSARQRWRFILNSKAPATTSFAYKAFNRQTGQRVGSKDGTTWQLINHFDSNPD